MSAGTVIVGIDIAKDTFDVALLRNSEQQSGTFNNNPAGFKQLAGWLRKRKAGQVWACMEATGRYGEALAEYLHTQGHTVSVVNPMAIKAYGQSKLLRNKSDKLDASLIARYCQSEQPATWSPPAPEIRVLRELVHQYDNLQQSRQQVRNRLGAGLHSDLVRAQMQAQLDLLEQQLAQLKQAIQEHLDAHPDLKREHDLLRSIPGIGLLTAAKIQAVDPQRFDDARKLSAFAGVTPMNRDSGSSVHRRARFSKIGDAALRRALYMPAIVAMRVNPAARELYQRLRQKGMAKKAAIGAVMHKLLRQAFGVLKSGQPFNPNLSNKAAATP
jgi:transposase